MERHATTATLSWEAPTGGNITGYRVEVQEGGDVYVNETVEGATSYDLFNMTPGTQYDVRVFAVKCDRELNSQNISFTTSESLPRIQKRMIFMWRVFLFVFFLQILFMKLS